jgi:hypothetical protein
MSGSRSRVPFTRREVWLTLAFVLTLPLLNARIRGDGNGYYAYLRSAMIDGDLQFENEYRHGDVLFKTWAFQEDGALRPARRTATDHVTNHWAAGPALLWLPFFLAGHGVALAAGAPADGFSPPYLIACAIGTAFYAWLALLLSYRMAARRTSEPAAFLAVIGIWLASSLPVYIYFLPFHVHALCAFAGALLLWCREKTLAAEQKTGRWLAWGLAGGLAVSVYNLNAVLLLVPAFDWAFSVRGSGARRPALRALALACGAVIGLIPHVVAKTILFGSPFTARTSLEKDHVSEAFFWSDPRLLETAFSSNHGALLWTPILALSVAGLILVAMRDRRFAVSVGIPCAVFYYVVASYNNWHGLSSFGNRFFVSLTAVFVAGLAIVIQKLAAKTHLVPAVAVALLVLWNAGLMFQWGTNVIPSRGPVDFRAVVRNQFTVVPVRAVAFLGAYIRNRGGTVTEIEAADVKEKQSHRSVR